MGGDLKIVSREQLHGVFAVFDGNTATAFIGESNGIGPKVGCDGLWPAMFGVHNHGACPILQVTNTPLRYPILEVSVHATKCQLLSLLVTIESKTIVREAAVVAVIALDLDVVTERVPFKGMFRSERLHGAVGFLHVHKGEAAEVINENGGAGKSFVG